MGQTIRAKAKLLAGMQAAQFARSDAETLALAADQAALLRGALTDVGVDLSSGPQLLAVFAGADLVHRMYKELQETLLLEGEPATVALGTVLGFLGTLIDATLPDEPE